MKLRIRTNNGFKDIRFLGTDAENAIDAFCALLLVLMPILQHYKGPMRNAGFSALIIVFPFLTIKMLVYLNNKALTRNCILAIVPLMLYELYTVLAHGMTLNNFVFVAFTMILYWSLACGAVNIRMVFRLSVLIAKVASILVILQFFLYRLLHYHLKIIPTGLLLPGSDRWLARSIVGVARAGAMYRPSGLFLEPSHMVLYCIPILCLLLLEEDFNTRYLKDALLISIGVLLSTSGMGILIVVTLWGLYWVIYKKNIHSLSVLRKVFSLRTMLIVFAILAVLVISYMFVPFIKDTVLRVFNPEEGRSVAISGRVRLANSFIKRLSGSSLLFGVSERAENIEFNLAGFHATLYKWGIVGVFLSYWYYGRGLFKLTGGYFFLTAIILVLSFFSAHTHGTFYMLYFSFFLLNGYYVCNPKPKNIQRLR